MEEKSFKIHLSSEKPSDTKVDNKTSSKSENSSKEVELAEKSKDKEVKVANLIYNKKILQINTEEANRYFKRSEEKLDKAIQDFEIALEAENKNNVEDRKSSYKRLKEQINVRNELIIHIGKLERASIHGFGRKAFQEASLELNYLHLTQRYVFVQVEEQIEKVKSQSRFYILPFLFSFIYLIAWWYGLRFWRKQLCNFLKSYDRSDYMLAKPIWRATPWFIYELQKPIALVLFTYFFIIIVGKPFDISDIGPVTT